MFKGRTTLLVIIALLVAACGGDSGQEDTTTTTAADTSTTSAADTTTTTTAEPDSTFPVEVGGVTIPARPDRILSGTATHTEILFAIGAGSQVAGVDLWSDYPAEIADLERFDAFEPNVEAIAALDPDLVIISFDPGGVIGDAMGVFDIPVLILDAPNSLEEMFGQYADIGIAVDRIDETTALIAGMRADIDEIVAGLPDGVDGGTFYHELDPTPYSITSDTFLGEVYGLLGLTSIADSADAGPFPQLSIEFIVDSDPEWIFLGHTEWSGETAETVGDRPGWSTISAVANERVFAVSGDLSSRWSPRIVDLLRSLAAMVLEGAD